MTVLLSPRTLKALQVAAGASRWVRLIGRSFAMPSQSNPRHLYIVSPDTCQCADSEHNPEQLCKHQLAVQIVLALIETQPKATPIVGRMPVTTREDY